MSQRSSETAVSDIDGVTVTGERSRPVEWVILTGRRPHVAASVLGVVFVVATTAIATGVAAVSNPDTLTRSFAALIAGNFTLITITISINQLILSRQFDTPDELYEHVDEAIDYRERVERTAGSRTAPVTPEAFLDFIGRRIRDHAETLLAETPVQADAADQRAYAAIEAYAETLSGEASQLTTTLEGSSRGIFGTLLAILDVDLAGTLHATHAVQTRHGSALSDDATAALEDVANLLEFAGVARQYFKTLYIQEELSDLSRHVFYTGVPALLVPLVAIWVYGAESGATISGLPLRALVVVTAVVGLAPFATFFAHVTRIATLTRRTASLMPFRFDEQDSGGV